MRVLPNHAAGERPPLFLNGREGEGVRGWGPGGSRLLACTTSAWRCMLFAPASPTVCIDIILGWWMQMSSLCLCTPFLNSWCRR